MQHRRRAIWLGPASGGFPVPDWDNALIDRWTPQQGRDSLLALLTAPPPPDVVVVDCQQEGGVQIVREVASGAPLLQIVFLATPEQQRWLRQKILPVGRIGNNWSICDPGRDHVAKQLAEAARSTERRRRLRTTLDAFNSRQRLARLEPARARSLSISASFLASILAQAEDAIVSTDLTGIIITANEAAEKLWSLDRSALLRTRIWECFNESERTSLRHSLETLATRPQPPRLELELLRPNGSRVPVELTLGKVRDEAGICVACSIILRDISDRRESQAALARHAEELQKAHDAAVAASRAKDDFLAALSHELRNPLNPVLLIASDAAGDETLAPAVRSAFETIYKNVELEARIIDDLLDLTKVARRQIAFDLRVHDLHDLVRHTLTMIDAEVAEKSLETQVDLRAEKSLVLADNVRLQQVLWNVLKNAVKFTPEHGRLMIRTDVMHDGSTVQLEVSDSGIGMTEVEVRRAFDAFAQGEHAERGSHRFGGLGLGLSISRSLVELHHGRILASSPGRDQGSTFLIELPLADPAVDSPASAGTPAAEAAHARAILVVEDHAETRLTLARLLRRRNYRVLTAGSVAEARKILEGGEIELLISDIGLPDGSGHDLMSEVLRKADGVKGIALTGYGADEDRERSRMAGFAFHMTKPVTVESLEQALAAVARG